MDDIDEEGHSEQGSNKGQIKCKNMTDTPEITRTEWISNINREGYPTTKKNTTGKMDDDRIHGETSTQGAQTDHSPAQSASTSQRALI